jgi:hypothetical protein
MGGTFWQETFTDEAARDGKFRDSSHDIDLEYTGSFSLEMIEALIRLIMISCTRLLLQIIYWNRIN